MDQLRDLFFNPPQGGNEHGVRAPNLMEEPPRQPQQHVGGTFIDGVESARAGAVESSRTDNADMRNYGRGDGERYFVHIRPEDTVYESEAMLARRDRLANPPVDEQPEPRKVVPTLVPAQPRYRSDGKPL